MGELEFLLDLECAKCKYPIVLYSNVKIAYSLSICMRGGRAIVRRVQKY